MKLKHKLGNLICGHSIHFPKLCEYQCLCQSIIFSFMYSFSIRTAQNSKYHVSGLSVISVTYFRQ